MPTIVALQRTARGEQNTDLLHVGSKQDAAQPASTLFIFTLFHHLTPWVHENPPGEGTTPEWHAIIDIRPERSKSPNLREEDLQESGGVSALATHLSSMVAPETLTVLGLCAWPRTRTQGESNPRAVDAHERGGALPVAGAAPTLAEETAGVEPAGEAERAAAAKSEALAPWTQGETRDEVETLREGKREADEPPLEALPQKGERKLAALLRERECERARTGAKRKTKVEAPARKGERGPWHERGTTQQGNPNKGECEPSWPPREPSHEDRPVHLGGRPWGTWKEVAEEAKLRFGDAC